MGKLEMKNLTKTFNPGTVNEKTALSGLSLTVEDGDFITIVGSNGAGKSTLFHAIGALDKVSLVTTAAPLCWMGRILLTSRSIGAAGKWAVCFRTPCGARLPT